MTDRGNGPRARTSRNSACGSEKSSYAQDAGHTRTQKPRGTSFCSWQMTVTGAQRLHAGRKNGNYEAGGCETGAGRFSGGCSSSCCKVSMSDALLGDCTAGERAAGYTAPTAIEFFARNRRAEIPPRVWSCAYFPRLAGRVQRTNAHLRTVAPPNRAEQRNPTACL